MINYIAKPVIIAGALLAITSFSTPEPASAQSTFLCQDTVSSRGGSKAAFKGPRQRRAMRRAKRRWIRAVQARYGERFANFSNARNVTWNCETRAQFRNCNLNADPCG